MEWIQLPQDMVKLLIFVTMVMKFPVSRMIFVPVVNYIHFKDR
jgi:hypothetical protein